MEMGEAINSNTTKNEEKRLQRITHASTFEAIVEAVFHEHNT